MSGELGKKKERHSKWIQHLNKKQFKIEDIKKTKRGTNILGKKKQQCHKTLFTT
jgi:hypothetical protein